LSFSVTPDPRSVNLDVMMAKRALMALVLNLIALGISFEDKKSS